MSAKNRRSNFWTEESVQGALVRRLIVYWAVAWLWIVGLTFLANFTYSYLLTDLTTSEIIAQALGLLWPPVLVSVVVLPLVLRDYIRLSHRFCGPMVRFRRVVQQLCDGEQPQPIRLRKKDYWHDFAGDINRLIAVTRAEESRDEALETPADEACIAGEGVEAKEEVLAEQA